MSSFKLDGTSSIIGKSYYVKTNGKQGSEIRYYINESKEKAEKPLLAPEDRQELAKMSEVLAEKEEVSEEELSKIPF